VDPFTDAPLVTMKFVQAMVTATFRADMIKRKLIVVTNFFIYKLLFINLLISGKSAKVACRIEFQRRILSSA
jgi:hypothetical protein